MLRTQGLSLRSRAQPVRLLAIGSVLHFAQDGDVVWGTGRNGKIPDEAHAFRHLDVRAVRGPLTRAYLEAKGMTVPEIYGDPALLIPEIFPSFAELAREKRHDYLLVPNLHDIRLVENEPNVVRPTQNWKDCVKQIVQSRFVVASSLHGIIVAEAFGIPARMLRLSDTEPDFKYQDYYAGTGRGHFHAARTLEEARDLGGEPAPTVDLRALHGAFPFDLWNDALASQ